MMKTGLMAAVLMAVSVPGSAQVALSRDTRIEGLLEQVSAERLEVIAERLASFETRHTLSTPTQTDRGIGAARQWILEEMSGYSPRLRVSFDTYRVPPAGRITREAELSNVMAVLPGRSDRRVYVSGHYDTVVLRPPEEEAELAETNDNYAPGANDDGSGTALTMELARVFAESGIEFDATLVFIALAGEEMGLVGARVHAQAAAADSVRIDAVLNNDIIGNSRGGDGTLDAASLRVFSEGPEDSPSRQLARYVRRIASVYVPGHEIRLIAREDRFGRGGDHTAFNQNGYAGVRISESKENYERQHTILDTPDGMDFDYLAKNARVNAAAAAGIALAPPQPVVLRGRNPMVGRGESGYDAQLRWQASPGAVGYRVFWREAWGPDWQHDVFVGDVMEYTLEGVSIDDYVFGVAAVGPDGIESLVSAYERPPRANVPVRTGSGAGSGAGANGG
jgi:hypothetical protein